AGIARPLCRAGPRVRALSPFRVDGANSPRRAGRLLAMRRLYVLYDSGCGLCTWARRWLSQQQAFLELVFIPAGSEWAARGFPEVARPGQVDELVVVADDGGVYRDARAWIICLYALVEYREWSIRLAQPLLLPLARQAFALLSKRRRDVSRWFD